MVPALLWGTILFGVRVFLMLASSLVVATVIHALLKRWLPWQRGRSLLYPHTVVSTLVLIGLAHPMWPVWSVASMAILLPLILALVGGPGRERVHVAAVLAFAIQFAIMPILPRLHTYAGGPGGRGGDDAILAHDRLFMGDIREQRNASLNFWPPSRELNGADAIHVTPPALIAARTFDALSQRMEAASDSGRPEESLNLGLTPEAESDFRDILNKTFAFQLPGMDMQILGVVPNRVGTVSFIAIALAGLYLAYRYILRPRSVVLFSTSFILGTLLFSFWPTAVARVGTLGVWSIIKTFPAELLTLFNFLLFNSDAAFAAVFILALPRTEPLTARARRMFLLSAGILGAAVHRIDPTLPAATLILCALMPFAPLFDRLLSQRSWLNARP
jgi:hypothetical protein